MRHRLSVGWDLDALFIKPHGVGRMKQNAEQKKRGCHYCADFKRKCPYAECPYHELDEFKTYDEYLKKGEKNGLVKLLEDLG